MKNLFAVLLILLFGTAFCQKEQVYQTKAGAISGYDPVAYFTDGQAVKGEKSLSYDWEYASWYFASTENLETFKADPEQYAPQYGGYCAYAVANGYTAKSDPDAWKIVDGKLYLNYDKNIRKKWEAQQAEFIKSGDANWPKVLE